MQARSTLYQLTGEVRDWEKSTPIDSHERTGLGEGLFDISHFGLFDPNNLTLRMRAAEVAHAPRGYLSTPYS